MTLGVTRLRRLFAVTRAGCYYRPTTGLHRWYAQPPNRVQRTQATGLDHIWVGDLTYLAVAGRGWYLAVVLDQCSRRVLAWRLAMVRDAALTRVVVDAALRRRQPPGALICLLNRGNIQAWNQEFESYTRIRYAWTLSSEWPRLAMAQLLISQMLYFDTVVYDWAHIQALTLVCGGADDLLLGSAETFQERMNELAKTVPNDNGEVVLLPEPGHVPHLESPERVLPPLVSFLKKGVE